ncbi:putative membrane protein [Helicobacter pylori Hp P-8b]|nr:putative membrane protein [Helicobacter pylori Hp P-8]EJC28441.1 putative membrane protein [Helicobacter pylori Hp P-8b]
MLLLKNALFLIGLITHEILASFSPLFCFCAGVFISSLF